MKHNRFIFFLLSLIFYPMFSHATDAPRLSPMPGDFRKNNIGLSGKWFFNPSPEKEFWRNSTYSTWKDIEVPGEWVMQGFTVDKGKAAGYVREFTIPSSWKGKRTKLRCNGIYSESKIYINGKEAGYHLGGFTPFELDVTSLVNTGQKNTIAVSVTSETLADSLASASTYAVHTLGGITRDLYLFSLPEVNISSFHVQTTFDKEYKDATLTAELEICNELNQQAANLETAFRLYDATGKEISLSGNIRKLNTVQAGTTAGEKIQFQIAQPIKWDSENPYLYTLTTELKQNNKVLQQTSRRVGFRQVEVRGNELFVNNLPIKLRGVCRHEVMPLRGRSVNGDTWKQDVALFRNANVNYIRTSHYPPDEALLEACDELGMFVEEEAPFCWAHNTSVPKDKHNMVLVNQHLEMINRDRSHPSVIIWSMGNESNLFEEYFKQAAIEVQKIDPTRPRIFSQWGPDADNNMLEIGNHHYPGPEGPNMYRNSKRPIIFDEYCHLNAYNRLELAADPGVRDVWGQLLNEMWDNMYHSKGVLGGALWAGIDDTFFLPDGNTVGYGTWGPIDGWRREKPEYWNMKKAYSPVKIKLQGNVNEKGELFFTVENRHNFTNLSACKINWSTLNDKGNVSVDIAPRKEGQFKINSLKLKDCPYIDLSITCPQGNIIDQYRFAVRPEQISTTVETIENISLGENEYQYIITGKNYTCQVSKLNGLMQVTDKAGSVSLQNAPQLMILPLNGEGRGVQMTGGDQRFAPYTPVCKGWKATSIQPDVQENVIKLQVNGSYEEAEGSFVYSFYGNGKIEFAYNFQVNKPISPRQTGLVFPLPGTFNTLAWERIGYWSVYPENHIGRLTGTAKSSDKHISESGLAGPDKQPKNDWFKDQTDAGSNDFRSTKTNIKKASLTNGKGSEIQIHSDGNQHIRTWIDDMNTLLLVADYNNAGQERFFVSHAEKGYKPLKKGDYISGTITLFNK